jgi:hypothetical protein
MAKNFISQTTIGSSTPTWSGEFGNIERQMAEIVGARVLGQGVVRICPW